MMRSGGGGERQLLESPSPQPLSLQEKGLQWEKKRGMGWRVDA